MYRLYPESSRKLVGAEAIRNYIYGGRGVVTLKAPSGKSHTYIFAKPKNEDVFPDDVLFVYALHEGVKQFYVGMVEKGRFRLTRHSRFLHDTEIVKGAYYIMKMATTPELDTPMELYHNGMCCFCGRQLTSEKSIDIGIGPRCKKLRLEYSKHKAINNDEEIIDKCGDQIKNTSEN